MNNYNLSFRLIGASMASLLIIVALLFSARPDTESYAKVGSEFSQNYGLTVHNTNENDPVPRLKVLQVLFEYFPEVKAGLFTNVPINFRNVTSEMSGYEDIKKACKLRLFDCSSDGLFFGNLGIYQQDLLIWFYKLKYSNNTDYLKNKYPKITDEYTRAWLEARSFNLIEDTQVTYKVFSNLLYRNKVVENNLNQAYAKNMVLDYREISADNYHNLKEIQEKKNDFAKIIQDLSLKDKLSVDEKTYYDNMTKNLQAVYALEQSLAQNPYVLKQYPDMDSDMADAIRKNNLQEVLYSYSYDYSKNAAYRKHNLTAGAKKMDGKVFMDGEIINYWDIVSDNNLSEFTYGWVILGSQESWQFGGGLCGAASTIFIPSWQAGLEVVERKPHSKYYKSLYPIEYIGLDSTVYRPNPNMKLKNNTGSAIVYKVDDDKEKQVITVSIIGNRAYKNINIEGPIYITNKHIKWVRKFQKFDDNIVSEAIESRYDSIL